MEVLSVRGDDQTVGPLHLGGQLANRNRFLDHGSAGPEPDPVDQVG
jgi:hypothetical protein